MCAVQGMEWKFIGGIGRNHCKDLDLDGRMILKWILMDCECRLRNGFDRELGLVTGLL